MVVDPHFRVEVIRATQNPQQAIYAAMHQDYSEGFVVDECNEWPDEKTSGELVVKHLLNGNRGHYGCYDAQTEVLTDQGWVRWPDVTHLMRLLAVDIQSGLCHFEQPKQLQVFEFVPGDRLYSLSSSYLNFAVTLDHRMVVSHRTKSGGFSDWYFKPASEVIDKPVRYLLNSCLKPDARSTPGDLPHGVDVLTAFKLAGFFFGDGVRTQSKQPECVRFRIRRPRKIAYLLSLGLPTQERKGDRYTVTHPELAAWIHRYFSSDSGKMLPDWLLTLPESMVAAFWDGLKNSDGTRVTEKGWSYDSCDKKCLDLIQAIAHINGFSANMTLNSPCDTEGHENHRPCWRIHISEHSTKRVETCQDRTPGVTESLNLYSGYVYCATVSTGALMVRRNNKAFVSGNCLEHPQIILNCGWFPHSTMQQIRTHRVGVSFDVQSGRYTGNRIIDAAEGKRDVEEVFYLRPVGEYSDRQGKKYSYNKVLRDSDKVWCLSAAKRYKTRVVRHGLSEEHARGLIPFDVRQHWVMSCNVRSLMHLLDLRWKLDAQLECQQLCDLIWPHFQSWVPAVAEWYKDNRAKKARLAP